MRTETILKIGVVLIVCASIGKIIWYFNTGWDRERVTSYNVGRIAQSYTNAEYSGYDDGYWSESAQASDIAQMVFINEYGDYPEFPPIYSGMEEGGFDGYTKKQSDSFYVESGYGKEEFSDTKKWKSLLNRQKTNNPLIANFHYGKFWDYE